MTEIGFELKRHSRVQSFERGYILIFFLIVHGSKAEEEISPRKGRLPRKTYGAGAERVELCDIGWRNFVRGVIDVLIARTARGLSAQEWINGSTPPELLW